jgi:hypothetical protein
MRSNGRHKGAVDQDAQITIAGQSLTVRFSNKAWIALEQIWGESPGEVQKRFNGDGLSITRMNDILWAALRTHHKEVTRDDVIDLLDDAGLPALPGIFEKLMAAGKAGQVPQEAAVSSGRPTKPAETSASTS